MPVMAEPSVQSVMTSSSSDTIVYEMVPVSHVSHAGAHEEVFSIVNYNVTDEIDEGYSTNYSPSSKSTSSFECDTSFDKSEVSSSDIQVRLFMK